MEKVFTLCLVLFFACGVCAGLCIKDYCDTLRNAEQGKAIAGYEWFEEEAREIEYMSAGVCALSMASEEYALNRDNLDKRISRYNIVACHKSTRQEWEGNCPYQYSIVEQLSKYSKGK